MSDGWDPTGALRAKRMLLWEQTERVGRMLPWLDAPESIPPLPSSDGAGGAGRPFAVLATWMLAEIVTTADSVHQDLSWEDAFARYRVPREQMERVVRAVTEPASRHAPGMFAMAEIVSAVPLVAARESIARAHWAAIARKAERFAALLSRDGSDLQVIVRSYLRGGSLTDSAAPSGFGLAAERLRLDENLGLTSLMPVTELIAAARDAVSRHIGAGALRGRCVALAARGNDGSSIYTRIWSAYVAAAERLIFPHLAAEPFCPAPATDPDFAQAIDAVAQARAASLRRGTPAQAWETARGEIFSREGTA